MQASNHWKGKKVLITGVNGFIGSHLARTLLDSGAEVHGTTRQNGKMAYLQDEEIAKHVHLHRADLLDFPTIENIIQSNQWDAIFHLAAQNDTSYSIKHPLETIQINVIGTANVLEAIRRHAPLTPFILGGSVRAFGASDKSEEAIHPYDSSKEAMESIAQSYFREYHLRGAIAKNTNIYGPNDLRFTRLIPLLMKGIFSTGGVTLYGDGTIKRDFMYIEDAVNGLLLLAQHLMHNNELSGKTFVFATGKMIEIKTITQLLEKISPKKCTINFNSQPLRHERELPSTIEDIAITHQVLGWKPQYSMENGMRETVEWYQQYFEREGMK